ncbi:MAG: response regulator [Deltaproteobacteria bacterium]|nr:response regulator [Deltaproteobacteria bacterium]
MTKKILVVDDEKIVCDMARIILQKEGYGVDTFTDSQLALDAIRERRYDLVVTDLKMENVSGMDILREVNQLYPETKVIMLTAYATLDATIEAIRERIYDFFPKPVKIEELKRSVKKALGD